MTWLRARSFHPVRTDADFKADKPRLVFRVDFPLADTVWPNPLTVGPDGRFLAVRRPPPERTERLPVYVPNWMDELIEILRRPR